MLWFIPGTYAAFFIVRLFVHERKTADWLVPIIHLAIWGNYLSSAKPSALNEISQSLTMSWGIYPLVIVLIPLVLDRKKNYPEWFDASLLVGIFFSALWISSIHVKLATPLSSWSLGATWLFDLTGAFLIAIGMLAWRLYLDGAGKKGEISRWYRQLQASAVIFATLGLLSAFQQTEPVTTLKQGYFLFILLAVGNLLLPATQRTSMTPSFQVSVSSKMWAFSGALFTISWSLVRLFVMV